MNRQTDGVIVLRVALGSGDWVKNYYASLAYQSESLIDSILSMESKQCAFLLLKHCAHDSHTTVVGCERNQCALNAHCPDPVSNQFECGSIFGAVSTRFNSGDSSSGLTQVAV